VVRDFQVSPLHGFIDGQNPVGGPWNVITGVAGILDIVALDLGLPEIQDRALELPLPPRPGPSSVDRRGWGQLSQTV